MLETLLLKWRSCHFLHHFRKAATATNNGFGLIVAGNLVVRYNNEAGKGDHKHIGDNEVPYVFISPEPLLDDFWNDVEKWWF